MLASGDDEPDDCLGIMAVLLGGEREVEDERFDGRTVGEEGPARIVGGGKAKD